MNQRLQFLYSTAAFRLSGTSVVVTPWRNAFHAANQRLGVLAPDDLAIALARMTEHRAKQVRPTATEIIFLDPGTTAKIALQLVTGRALHPPERQLERAGQDHAFESGHQPHRERARVADQTRSAVKRLVEAGKPERLIAKALGIGMSTVHNIKKKLVSP